MTQILTRAGGVTGVGLAAHAIGQTVSGRMFKGGPTDRNRDQHASAEKKGGESR